MDEASRKKSQRTRKVSHREEDSGTSSTRPSTIPKPAQSSSSPRKPRFQQTLLPASQRLLNVQRPSAKLAPAPPGTINPSSKSELERGTSSREENEPTHIDGWENRISIPQDDSPGNEDAASHADSKAHPLPDSNEFEAMWGQIPRLDVRYLEHQKPAGPPKEILGLNSLLLSVNKRRSILSHQVKQICEDGMAFYQYAPSSLIQASVADAEIFRNRWNELQSATTVYVNELLEFEDDRRTLAIKQDMLDHPEKHKHGRAIADEHAQSEIGTEAKTSITVPLVSEVKLTADGVETRRALQNEIDNLQNRIEELYRENYSLTSGLEGADLENLDLGNDQKVQISENNGIIAQHEMKRRTLKLTLHQLMEEMEAVRAAA